MEILQKMRQKVHNSYLVDTRFYFYCNVRIKVPLKYGKSLLDDCFEIMKVVDRTYNSYTSGSYFDLLNQHAGNWIDVDEDTLYMLKEIDIISSLTNGIYHIGILPLLQIWKFYDKDSESLPTGAEIEQAVLLVKSSVPEINGNKVRIAKGCSLMTGSFIKAFAVDKVVRFLQQEGVDDALINAGGSTIYALNNENHPFWKVNIPHPEKIDSYWLEVPLQNACLSLSGRKQHYREINGKKYSHVINADTGYPSTHYQAVTLTESAFLGDMLSTALMANDTDATVLNTIHDAYSKALSYYIIDNGYEMMKPEFINC